MVLAQIDDEDKNYFLIANLHLQDMEDISGVRKGKGREDTPLSDEELAFQLQAEILKGYLGMLEDRKIALSLGDAMDSDHGVLENMQLVEQAVEDDHRYAAALSSGQPLPEKSQAQKFLEEVQDPEQFTDPESEEIVDFGVSPMATPKASSSALPSTDKRAECAICNDRVNRRHSFQAPCNHFYCMGCLTDLVKACTGDESLYPLRCCHQHFNLDVVLPLLDHGVRFQFEVKSCEFGTEPADRLYCANPVCSEFLGSCKAFGHTTAPCFKCWTDSCAQCKSAAHPGAGCTDNTANLAEIKALAQEQGWQTCPGCGAIVELHHGCNHMTCRCRTEFCYVCAVRWKNCPCPQWEERRLIETAELRVQNEVQHQRVAVEEVQQRVHRTVQHLRYDHDCYPHRWQYRDGGGVCEECGHYLNLFLKVCRGCRMLACVRCTRNRL
ncbi:ibr domain-containing protein [Moniliophthora roreri MCA 2997]|uniref:RBR-type E3 ubiquitin transferase n=1 Tax=Moniliophthora roreri (strain MCA 2997) TaxID=1381753 RepID=V2WSB8_MONRO|nr:ibr domain-containing protein [Moniliophthora roreri MCA 2997]